MTPINNFICPIIIHKLLIFLLYFASNPCEFLFLFIIELWLLGCFSTYCLIRLFFALKVQHSPKMMCHPLWGDTYFVRIINIRRVPNLSALSQYRQQGSQFQVRTLDMDIKLIIILAMPLDRNRSETIFQIKHLLSDANGQLFAVAHCHFSEQHISAVWAFTDMLQQHGA